MIVFMKVIMTVFMTVLLKIFMTFKRSQSLWSLFLLFGNFVRLWGTETWIWTRA